MNVTEWIASWRDMQLTLYMLMRVFKYMIDNYTCHDSNIHIHIYLFKICFNILFCALKMSRSCLSPACLLPTIFVHSYLFRRVVRTAHNIIIRSTNLPKIYKPLPNSMGQNYNTKQALL
jgi:hypothetical protein